MVVGLLLFLSKLSGLIGRFCGFCGCFYKYLFEVNILPVSIIVGLEAIGSKAGHLVDYTEAEQLQLGGTIVVDNNKKGLPQTILAGLTSSTTLVVTGEGPVGQTGRLTGPGLGF